MLSCPKKKNLMGKNIYELFYFNPVSQNDQQQNIGI